MIGYSGGKLLMICGRLEYCSLTFDILIGTKTRREWSKMYIQICVFTPGVHVDAINAISHDRMGIYTVSYYFHPVSQLDRNKGLAAMADQTNTQYFSTHSGTYGKRMPLLSAGGTPNFVNIYLVFMLKCSKEYGIKKISYSAMLLFLQLWTEIVL